MQLQSETQKQSAAEKFEELVQKVLEVRAYQISRNQAEIISDGIIEQRIWEDDPSLIVRPLGETLH